MSEGLPVGEVTIPDEHIPCTSLIPQWVKEYNVYLDEFEDATEDPNEEPKTFGDWLQAAKQIPAVCTSAVSMISINDGYWYTWPTNILISKPRVR